MNPITSVRLVARRELAERLRDRAFRISTAVTLVIVAVLVSLPGLFGGDPDTWKLGAVGADARAALEQVVPPGDTRVRVVDLADRAAAESALTVDDVRLAVVDGRVLGHREVDDTTLAAVQAALAQRTLVAELTAAGASAAAVERALAAPPAAVDLLEPRDPDRESRSRWIGIGAFVLFGQIFGYVFWVASAVTEEKASRVVELLLAKLRPRHLLAGKVVGVGLLGLGQTLLILAVGLGGAAVTGADLPGAVLTDVIGLLVWFALGFGLFSALFAMAGALAARQEDLQNTTAPLTIVMFACMAGGFVGVADPEALAARVLSLVPFTAPLVMPMRVAAGAAAVWEVAVAAALVVATAAVLLRLAGRVYTGAALRTSGRIGLRQAWADAAGPG